MTSTIRHIVLTGNTVASWQSALALSKLMPFNRLDITVVCERHQQEENRVIKALPTQDYFHRVLGINEKAFMSACDARFVLAERYHLDDERAFFLAYTEGMCTFSDIGNQHVFSRILSESPHNKNRYGSELCLSLAAAAEALDKFSHPNSKRDDINQELSYGYTFLSEPYCAFIKQRALKAGVTCLEVDELLWDVKDGLFKLCVSDQNAHTDITADFFIDSSSEADKNAAFKSLVKLSVNDKNERVFFKENKQSIKGRNTAVNYEFRDGLLELTKISRGHKSSIQYAFAHEQYGADTGDGQRDRNKNKNIFRDVFFGYATSPWHSNKLYLGGASSNLADLAVDTIQLAQSSILRFIELFPFQNDFDTCAKEFNALSDIELSRVADFHIAQLIAPKLTDQSVCQAYAGLPTSFLNKMCIFKRKGELARYESETISEGMWLAFFLKCGVVPTSYSPFLDDYSIEEIKLFLDKRMRFIQSLTSRMPQQHRYISHYLGMQEEIIR